MPVKDSDQFSFEARDGTTIVARLWPANGPTRLVLVVAHGMGEHGGRYRASLGKLTELGIAIYAPDHRGHGATALDGEHGDFGPGGFLAVIDDLAVLVERAAAEHPDVPVVLLGHSMGSFAAQVFVLDHADLIDGLALSGSAALDVLGAAASAMDGEGNILEAFNGPFEPGRTKFDWLSRSESEVDRYLQDRWCGFAVNDAGQVGIFGNASRTANPAALASLPKNLPIYIFSGARDPLANPVGALEPLIDRYRAAGLDVTTDLYPEGRHEILNEINRDEVVENLAGWLRTIRRRER